MICSQTVKVRSGAGLAMYALEVRVPEIRNRTWVEILSSILDVAGNGALKTHIMYKANLSHRQLEKYLELLKQNGLLEEVSDLAMGVRHYKTTRKGTDFLRDYSRLSGHFSKMPQFRPESQNGRFRRCETRAP